MRVAQAKKRKFWDCVWKIKSRNSKIVQKDINGGYLVEYSLRENDTRTRLEGNDLRYYSLGRSRWGRGERLGC